MALNFPDSPVLNEIYSYGGNSWTWDGSSWNSYSSNIGNASVAVSSSAPTSGTANQDFWWDSDTGMLKIYYNDGTSSQWVDAISVQGSNGSNNIVSNNTILAVDPVSQIFKTEGFSIATDSISKAYIVRGITSGNTETELYIDSSNTRISVSNNSTMFYTVDIVARRTDAANESAGFYLKGVVDNFNNTVADVGNLYETIVARDDANYSVDARADDTNNTINIYVTGVAAKTIRWVGLVRTVEVSQ